MRGDDDELIMPGTFLYNAERFGLIQSIDRWVVGQAIELLHAYSARGVELTTVADQLVVRAVVEIARGLGADTVAEFVQDDATLQALR
jgi:EAL domain-containing protein (putative c-di-GMP-specific phosphodiesterase class I)